MNIDDITYKVYYRFFKFFNNENDDGCWEWRGYKDIYGYGIFSLNKKKVKAHRVSFLIRNKKINEKLCIDHICMNKKCVNPKHLREVDIRTNVLENSNSNASKNKAKTHCKNGHEFTEENTNHIKIKRKGIVSIGRRCLHCARNDNRRRRLNEKLQIK